MEKVEGNNLLREIKKIEVKSKHPFGVNQKYSFDELWPIIVAWLNEEVQSVQVAKVLWPGVSPKNATHYMNRKMGAYIKEALRRGKIEIKSL